MAKTYETESDNMPETLLPALLEALELSIT